jgi:hypothetical protein
MIHYDSTPVRKPSFSFMKIVMLTSNGTVALVYLNPQTPLSSDSSAVLESWRNLSSDYFYGEFASENLVENLVQQ